MWMSRIYAETITHGYFQHFFHKHLETIDLLIIWHHPKSLQVLLGVLLFGEAFHTRKVSIETVVQLGTKKLQEQARRGEDMSTEDFHVGGRQAVNLGCFSDSEVNSLGLLIKGDVEHGIFLCFRKLYLFLLQVQDIAEDFAISVNKAVALAVLLCWDLPTKHGPQHGVWKASQSGQRGGIELASNIERDRF
uniref:Uncharacterized protein n=1 Tax=Junco hyemalis TaxID=40217 RepID=A0A8C5NRM3_JUNHY